MTKTEKVRVWTLFSSYSTDHDAMKWFVSKESEITPEVERPSHVRVVALDDIMPVLRALEGIGNVKSYRGLGHICTAQQELQSAHDAANKALEPFRHLLQESK